MDVKELERRPCALEARRETDLPTLRLAPETRALLDLIYAPTELDPLTRASGTAEYQLGRRRIISAALGLRTK